MGQGTQAIIDAGINVHNIAMLLDGVDSGQKTGALQTIAIELIRRNIGSRHQRDAAGEQGFHQTAQQHGVSNIGDKKLVETEHVGFRFKAVGDNLQRVAMALQGGQLFMHPQHKAMEMQALLTLARQALVKQVHQPGFPSPHAAPHIQAADRRRLGCWFALTQQFAEFRAQTAA